MQTPNTPKPVMEKIKFDEDETKTYLKLTISTMMN